MLRFGAWAERLREAGVPQLVAVSHDSPFAHTVWAQTIGADYPLLSDWSWEAARAFGVLRDELYDCYRPLNTRAAFLVDRGGAVRYAWEAESGELPEPEPVWRAAQALAGGR